MGSFRSSFPEVYHRIRVLSLERTFINILSLTYEVNLLSLRDRNRVTVCLVLA